MPVSKFIVATSTDVATLLLYRLAKDYTALDNIKIETGDDAHCTAHIYMDE